jgi:hypothetical protein
VAPDVGRFERQLLASRRIANTGGHDLPTPDRVDADQTYKRMVFSEIGDDAFRWWWESSADGLAWTERWAIDYRRADDLS